MTRPKRGKTSEVTSPSLPALPADFSVDSLRDYMKENFETMLKKINDITEKMATKDCINNLLTIIDEQKLKIEQLESKVVVMESHIAQLYKSQEKADQYQRRLYLRINGIDVPNDGGKETGDECLNKVKQVFDELNVDIPETVIDRAHRVGKIVTANGKKVQQMIVRMTTWRHRTIIYKARKNCNRYKIKLDLTKERLELLKRANELLNSDHNSFAFCNYNCQPCWFDNGRYRYFSSLDELQKLRHDV